MDRYRFDADPDTDPDPTFRSDADPDSQALDADPDGDPAKWRRSDWIRIHNTVDTGNLSVLFAMITLCESPGSFLESKASHALTTTHHSPNCQNSLDQCCGVGAEEPKLNCLPKPEPKLRIPTPAPAPCYLPQTWRNFIKKNHCCWRRFCKLLQF